MTGSRDVTALLLAADLTAPEGVAGMADVENKCLAPVAGTPIVTWPLKALMESGLVGHLKVATNHEPAFRAHPALDALNGPDVAFLPLGPSAPETVLRALERPGTTYPVLIATGDSALLTAEMVRHFADQAQASGADLAVGLAAKEDVLKTFPGAKRTFLPFKDGGVSGCNLFWLASEAALPAIRFWREAGRQRKSPLRLVASFGLWNLLLFALGYLTLTDAFGRASAKLGLTAKPVLMPWGEAAQDVDKPEDLELVRAHLEARHDR